MANHPVNLALRFVLEIAGLVTIGIGIAQFVGGVGEVVAGLLVVILAATLWAVFRVPGDDSAGKGLVAVPGWFRLILEGGMFGTAIILAGGSTWGLILAVVVMFHYAVSYDRLLWLARQY